MHMRRTWHQCADELDQVCQRFRAAHWGRLHGNGSWPRDARDEQEMRVSSMRGVEILRVLASALRAEADYQRVALPRQTVGVLRQPAVGTDDGITVQRAGGIAGLAADQGFAPLHLRAALNKIMHADAATADYYVGPGDGAHDLLLYGVDIGGDGRWFAGVSLRRLVAVVRELPDAQIVGE